MANKVQGNLRLKFPEKRNLNLVLYRSFSGNHREIRKVLKWKTAVFFTFPMRRRKKRLNFSGKSGFQSGIISPVFRKYEIKPKVLCPRQVRQKRRNPLYRAIPRHSFYSHSMQLNAFCLGTVLSSLHRDSDSTDYSYDLSYTARFYHLLITLIKSRSDCGLLRWNNYISSFRLSQFR